MNYVSDAFCKLAAAIVNLVQVAEKKFGAVIPQDIAEKMPDLQEAANKIASADMMAPVERAFKMPTEVSLVSSSDYPVSKNAEYSPPEFVLPIIRLNGVSISCICAVDTYVLVRSMDGKFWVKILTAMILDRTEGDKIVSISSTGDEFIVMFICDGELKFLKSSDGFNWTKSESIKNAEIHFGGKEDANLFAELARENLANMGLVWRVSQARKNGRLAPGWTFTCKEAMGNA